MDAKIGWLLAALATASGYWVYGWPGVAMAASVIVFWLLLQFSRAVRVMKLAAQAPVGTVPSAVMFCSKLNNRMRLMDVVVSARSLGRKVSNAPETFAWRDKSGAEVEVEFVDGRCQSWRLTRNSTA